MAGLIIVPNYMPALNVNGDPLPGAKMYFYVNGTTTPTTVYSDAALTTSLPNPLSADNAGVFAAIYSANNVPITVSITTALGIPLATYQDVYAAGSTNATYTLDYFKRSDEGDYTQAFIRVFDFFGDVGGVCYIAPGTYEVSNSFTGGPCINHAKPVRFIGLGVPGGADANDDGSVVIKHVGTSGTELVWHSNGGATSMMVGGGWEYVTFDFNQKARHTLRITDVQRFVYRQIFIKGAQTTGILIDNGSATANPCGWALMEDVHVDVHGAGSTAANAIHLRGRVGATPNTGVSMITWIRPKTQATNGHGFVLDGGDGQIFIDPFDFHYGTGYNFYPRGATSANWDENNGVYTGALTLSSSPIIASTWLHPIGGRTDISTISTFVMPTDLSRHETTITIVDYPAGDGQAQPSGNGANSIMMNSINGYFTRETGWIDGTGTPVDSSLTARTSWQSIARWQLRRRNSDTGSSFNDYDFVGYGTSPGSFAVYDNLASKQIFELPKAGGVSVPDASYTYLVTLKPTTTTANKVVTLELGDANKTIDLKTWTVGALPAANANSGRRTMVSDSSVTTFNSNVAGGGANTVPVFSDGTNWKVG